MVAEEFLSLAIDKVEGYERNKSEPFKPLEFIDGGRHTVDAVVEAMIEFAKYHVLKAQEAASTGALLTIDSGWGTYEHPSSCNVSHKSGPIKRDHPGHGDCTYEVIYPNRSVPFEVYSLENIK